MSVEKRIKVLMACLIAVTLAELLLAFLALLENATLSHIALVYGTQLILMDSYIISSRERLKREQARNLCSPSEKTLDAQAVQNVKYRLFLYILVSASVPLFTMYFASRFPLHLKIVIALTSLLFMNGTLFLSFRAQDRKA